MPITWSFTIAALVALILTGRKLRIHYWNRAELRNPLTVDRLTKRGADLEEMRQLATLLLWTSATMCVVNLVLLVVGAGALVGHQETSWAFVLLPPLTVLASFFDPA